MHQCCVCNPPQRAQQREGRDWAAKPGGLDTPGNLTISRHIKGSQGTSGHLGDALTPSGSEELHLAPFHPITLCISRGTGSFHFLVKLSELQLPQWYPPPLPSWLPWACGRSLQLTQSSPPPPAAPRQQLPAND